MASSQRKSNRKESGTMGDMYSLDNHEHILLMSDPSSGDEEEDIKIKEPIESQIDWSQYAENYDDDHLASGSEAACSESESNGQLLLDTKHKPMLVEKQQPIKQSLARKLLAFDSDMQASGDRCLAADQLLLDPFSPECDIDLGKCTEPRTVPIKWMTKRDRDPEYEAIRKMIIKSENNVNHIHSLKKRKQSDNEVFHCTSKLDQSVFVATRKYQNARTKTLELTMDMKENLELVAENDGEHWDFFREITAKWIKCLSGSTSFVNEFEEEANEEPIQDDIVYCQRRLNPEHINATPNKRMPRIRAPRFNPRPSFVSRNIKATKKSKPRNCMRLPKLTDEEAKQVDDLLCKCKAEEINHHQFIEDAPLEDTENYYQLSGNERQRIANLNAALGISNDTSNTKLRHSPRVKFADDLPTKQSSLKMMRRTDRKRISCIDQELSIIAMENTSSLTTNQLECVNEMHADDYSQFRAKRIVNYAFNLTNDD